MKFQLTKNIVFKTRLTEDEIINQLSESIDPVQLVRWSGFEKPLKQYEGQITGQSFQMNRIVRNSFKPMISGIVEKDHGATIIRVNMKIHTFVLAFMGIMLGIGLLGYTAFLIVTFDRLQFNAGSLFPLTVPAILCIVAISSFNSECGRSTKDLQQIFEAEVMRA